jgi:adenylate cyclase
VTRAEPLIEWILGRAPPANDAGALWSAICEQVAAAGVPIARTASALYALHPEVWVKALLWRRGQPTEVTVVGRGLTREAGFRESPIAALDQLGVAELRIRLEGIDPANIPFPELRLQASKGGTDYFIQRIKLSDGRASFASWLTDRPGGFSDEDLDVLRAIRPAVSLRIELASALAATHSLLDVYLGKSAANRVLAGAIERGRGVPIHAAIWYCDLRGFTTIGDRSPVREVILLLDRYFEAVAGAVLDGGGEVLKFIGDAMLAIFDGEADLDGAKRAALHATEEAFVALGRLNVQLGIEARAALAIGVALHVGDVMFGNIGARERLDFTAIGAPVNEVVRVESLCKPLGVPLLMSAAFAAGCGAEVVSHGAQQIEGKRDPIEVFTLPRYAARVAG